MFHQGNNAQRNGETTGGGLKLHQVQVQREYIDELQDQTTSLLMKIRVSLNYDVRHEDELEIN